MILTASQVHRHALFSAGWIAVCAAAVGVLLYWASPAPAFFVVALLPLLLYGAYALYSSRTRKYKRRLTLIHEPFPPAWEEILTARVAFYNALDEAEKKRFQTEMQIFLEEVPVTGVHCEVDDTIRVLVGASAIIPMFGFDHWEYDMLSEVLIYPKVFDASMEPGGGEEMNALGMVCTSGVCNGLMVLSKPDLLRGYEIHGDKHNVGIHEFAHLIDKATGDVDGIPVSLPPEAFKSWVRVMEEELGREYHGRPDIDPYGLTSQEEFFAVVSEYFFEAPETLEKKHPELYALMERIYRQEPDQRFKGFVQRIFRPRRKKRR